MTKIPTFSYLVACTVAVALGGDQPAAAAVSLSDNGVVRSNNGNVVRSLGSGNCVRTMWNEGYDACSPRTVEWVQTVLSQEDRTVYFGFNNATLTPQAKQRLDSLARTLRNAENVRNASIVGHADRMGRVAYNDTLSRKRAEAVKNYLAQQGYLNTSVAQVRGAGEGTPISACDPSLPRGKEIACLSPDRRVEVEIQYTDRRVAQAVQPPGSWVE